MSTPRVSVLVTAYQLAHFLPSALDSALAQDYDGELEVVVVDDGSTDDTRAVLEAYAARGVRAIHQENRGLVGAVDRGLREVTGGYVALLDADDEWPLDRVRRQVEHLEANAHVGLVHGDMELIDAGGTVTQASFDATQPEPATSGRVLGRLLGGNFISGGASMFRAALLPALLPIALDAAYPDWWIAVNVAAVAEVDHIPGIFNRYRFHGANMGLGATPDRLPQILRKEIPWRRWMLTHLLDDPAITLHDLQRALRSWESGLLQAASTGGAIKELCAGKPGASALVDEGVSLRTRDPLAAARLFLRALARDPFDGAARLELELCFALAPAAPPAAAIEPPLCGLPLRSDVTLAIASELARDPSMLVDYAATVSAASDATLVVLTEGEAEQHALIDAITSAGLDGDGAPDMLAIAPPATTPAIALLADRASDVLSERPPGAFAALPPHPALAPARTLR